PPCRRTLSRQAAADLSDGRFDQFGLLADFGTARWCPARVWSLYRCDHAVCGNDGGGTLRNEQELGCCADVAGLRRLAAAWASADSRHSISCRNSHGALFARGFGAQAADRGDMAGYRSWHLFLVRRFR